MFSLTVVVLYAVFSPVPIEGQRRARALTPIGQIIERKVSARVFIRGFHGTNKACRAVLLTGHPFGVFAASFMRLILEGSCLYSPAYWRPDSIAGKYRGKEIPSFTLHDKSDTTRRIQFVQRNKCSEIVCLWKPFHAMSLTWRWFRPSKLNSSFCAQCIQCCIYLHSVSSGKFDSANIRQEYFSCAK